MSRIGKKAVPVPAGVTASVNGQLVSVKGPKGELKVVLNDQVLAKMEAGDRSVSLDLLVKSLLRIGASPAAIAKWIRRAETNRAA